MFNLKKSEFIPYFSDVFSLVLSVLCQLASLLRGLNLILTNLVLVIISGVKNLQSNISAKSIHVLYDLIIYVKFLILIFSPLNNPSNKSGFITLNSRTLFLFFLSLPDKVNII